MKQNIIKEMYNLQEQLEGIYKLPKYKQKAKREDINIRKILIIKCQEMLATI